LLQVPNNGSSGESPGDRRIRVALVCPGLGHVNRGFETFTAECFDALRGDGLLDLHLYKGAGLAADREHVAWCLRRDRAASRAIGKVIGRDAYYVEQVAFTLALLPQLVRLRPNVIYFSDGVVGNYLWRWRRLSRGGFKLLLSNGGPLGPPAFPRFDHVHQVSEVYYEESLNAGRPAETQTLIPYGFRIDPQLRPLSLDDRAALRARLGIPSDRPVVLSVGAINHSHKRMDYVIREVASLPPPRPYLLLLGNLEPESPALIRMGNELLGANGFRATTVPLAETPAYYRAADAFVLASLHEGFGRAYVESLSHGLRCLAHDCPGARFVVGERGFFGDFRGDGALARLIRALRAGEDLETERQARHRSAYERFSWERLRESYMEMIRHCAAETNHGGPGRTGRFEPVGTLSERGAR
jgi:glycosyltransferase involved in cell wall biosynthesis